VSIYPRDAIIGLARWHDCVMTTSRFGTIAVHVLATIGVVFWVVTFVRTALGQIDASVVQVGLLALVLGGAHALISISTTRGSAAAIWLTVFVFISDSLLGIFVNPMAFLLTGFTVVLFIAVMLSRKTPNR
jgi:hypothetical protein